MGLGNPGVPGYNLPAGEDHIMRRLADIERAYRELVAATGLRAGAPIVGASISTAAAGERWEMKSVPANMLLGYTGSVDETANGSLAMATDGTYLMTTLASPQGPGTYAQLALSAPRAAGGKSKVSIFADRVVISPGLPPVYASNTAAITGGLEVGTLYRNGADPDHLCIVH